LSAADGGAKVLVLTKGYLPDSSSAHAQGGVAGAIGDDDTADLHAIDTEHAGRELCRPSAVRVLVEEGPDRIRELAAAGVPFDAELNLEAGHSRRRVSSVEGAATGWAITSRLWEMAAAQPRIITHEAKRIVSLLVRDGRCLGVLTPQGPIFAPATILAMGGMAAMWARTSNPASQTGDAVAIAAAAGVTLADLEFMQFHPTVLVGSRLLLSEALRGAGAKLLDARGERFINELLPRDEVARALFARGECYLDLRSINRDHFPGLMDKIRAAGYDPATAPVPVSPAAHYTIGGLVTDLEGRTNIDSLYAAGECAATGVHGANRLASNSLLECLVFGRRAALVALGEPPLPAHLEAEPIGSPSGERLISEELRERMWILAGVVREPAQLTELCADQDPVAAAVARFALARAESRGVHFRADAPEPLPAFDGHLVWRPGQALSLETWE
jgi:L-aspartate oxidase